MDESDASTQRRLGFRLRTSNDDGAHWSALSELSFYGADPERLDLANGASLLAFGGFDHRHGGLLAVAKRISTGYKASRVEMVNSVIWAISGAARADVKVRNLCTGKDLTSSATFGASGSSITVTVTESGAQGMSCVYALIGPESAIH